MTLLVKAVGRRKEAVAQVQIKLGTGQFIINNKPAQEYLQNDFYSLLSVKAPFNVLSNSASTLGEQEVNATTNNTNSSFSTENNMQLDTFVIVKGGGLRGQTEAIRLGISRALCLLTTNNSETTSLTFSNDVDIRKQLKDKGYLTQDSRVKERRKYGLKKARKASQYHKR
uniref:Small ribosomal subunit protein uS9c n=1 Tax=Volvulina compacta TaxID=51721 RepID=A0A6C0RWS9_9CHLO|nr:ribosomal protein S9 [Volvulina compacta]